MGRTVVHLLHPLGQRYQRARQGSRMNPREMASFSELFRCPAGSLANYSTQESRPARLAGLALLGRGHAEEPALQRSFMEDSKVTTGIRNSRDSSHPAISLPRDIRTRASLLHPYCIHGCRKVLCSDQGNKTSQEMNIHCHWPNSK